VAVDLARQIFSELAGRSVLLVGAGEMAEAAARNLEKAGARITLLSRTRARADDLARELGGAAVRGLHELDAALIEADIVLSSTSSPGYVLTREHVRKAQKARRHRSLFLIDIAVPRDVEPSVHELDEVYLYDVDDLSQLVAASLESRAGEVQKADAIVERELEAFGQRARGKSAGPTIAALRERVRGALEEELARSLAGKLRHLPEADRKALGVMLDSAVNRVLHEPSMRLKRHAAEGSADALVSALGELFALDAPSDGDRSACEGESLPPPEMVTARVGS
jgi:glutamyl-tRNA reductase